LSGSEEGATEDMGGIAADTGHRLGFYAGSIFNDAGDLWRVPRSTFNIPMTYGRFNIQ
jgi:hypothetical protein